MLLVLIPSLMVAFASTPAALFDERPSDRLPSDEPPSVPSGKPFGPPLGAPAQYSFTDVLDRITVHRRMVRMCGPLCALRVAAWEGMTVQPDTVLSKYDIEPRVGVRVRDVIELCRQWGLPARGIRLPDEPQSLQRLPIPSILLINEQQHCIVLEAVHDRTVRIWDPADLESKTINLATLDKLWAGHAIVFGALPIAWRLMDVGNVILGIVLLGQLIKIRWLNRRHGPNESMMHKELDCELKCKQSTEVKCTSASGCHRLDGWSYS